jgi:hypothetical protein
MGVLSSDWLLVTHLYESFTCVYSTLLEQHQPSLILQILLHHHTRLLQLQLHPIASAFIAHSRGRGAKSGPSEADKGGRENGLLPCTGMLRPSSG